MKYGKYNFALWSFPMSVCATHRSLMARALFVIRYNNQNIPVQGMYGRDLQFVIWLKPQRISRYAQIQDSKHTGYVTSPELGLLPNSGDVTYPVCLLRSTVTKQALSPKTK